MGISTTISSGMSLSCCSPMDDPSPLWPDTTLAAFPGVSVPSVSSPSRLSRSHADAASDDSDESLRSEAGGGGSRSSEDCSYDSSSVLGGGGGGCDGGGGGGLAGLGGCGAGCFFLTENSDSLAFHLTAPSGEEEVEEDATAAAVVLCLRVEPCESVGEACLGGEGVLLFGGSGGGGGEHVLVGVTEVTVVMGGEEKELDDVGEVLAEFGGETCGGENCIVGGLAYLDGGTAYGGDVIGDEKGGEGVVDIGSGGDLAVGEGVALVIGGESPGDCDCDFGGDGAEGWMGCGRSGVAVGVILVINSSPLPLPLLLLPSPMSASPPFPPRPPPPPLDWRLSGASDDESSDHFSFLSFPTMDSESESMGKGKTMVELCSVEMALSVCRYRSCSAEVDSSRTSAASFKCFEAFCSPSAATTLARASRAASASAAMALWSCTGTLTSFISTRSTCNHSSFRSSWTWPENESDPFPIEVRCAHEYKVCPGYKVHGSRVIPVFRSIFGSS